MKVKWIAIALGLLALLILPYAGLMGYVGYQERLRIQDAIPAFEPIEKLQPEFFSQPFGQRYCRYLIDFRAESLLSDANVDMLQSLNKLPEQNTLDISIRTARITDASLPVLASLRTLDSLDVTETALTDAGIEKLQSMLPTATIPSRVEKQVITGRAVDSNADPEQPAKGK